jgi:hypothetical protein
MPREAHGSYDVVADWTSYDFAERRAILERYGLIFTEQEEIMMTLRSESTTEPILY